MVAGFKSEYLADIKSESPAGFRRNPQSGSREFGCQTKIIRSFAKDGIFLLPE